MSDTPFRQFDPTSQVAIIGLGVIGAKVAWSCARSGMRTIGYDIDPVVAQQTLALAASWGSSADREAIRKNFSVAATLAEALEDAQLAFENVPEISELKRRVLADIGLSGRPEMYIGTNTSSLLSIPLAQASGRPARFFAMNFTDPTDGRLVELMAPAAAAETITFARRWARAQGMVPIAVQRDEMGYSFNRLWRVIKKEVLRQISAGISSPENIDRAWMLTFGTIIGPCGLMDQVGLSTIAAIEQRYADASGDAAEAPPDFLLKLVQAGRTGERAGSGLYEYPNPRFRSPGFLDGAEDSNPQRDA
jgi:3-hydroxybutyryl-CoA dehydrogenase